MVRRRLVPWVAVVALTVAAAAAARAMFAEFPEAPVKRLLANVTRALGKSPDDPHLLYLAGRTHAIAYAQGEDAKARAFGRTPDDDTALPIFGTRDHDLLEFAGEADDARLGHLRDGIRLLRRAAALAKEPTDARAPDDRPLLFLGLAWLLDDDGDGRLSGPEMDGVAVWRDLDGDGASGAGEVVPARDFGVAWIAVRATRTEDGVPAADAGVGLADGSTRPSYDWTPTSLPEPAPAAPPRD